MKSQCYAQLTFGLLLFFPSTYAATEKGCSLDVLRNPKENFLPVLLYNHTTDFSLIVPEKGHIILNHGDGITLLCPNQKNSLTAMFGNWSVTFQSLTVIRYHWWTPVRLMTISGPDVRSLFVTHSSIQGDQFENENNFANSNTTFAICIQDTTLKIFRKSYNFNSLLCKSPVRGDVQKTEERCGSGRGKINNIGYPVTRSYFESLIKSCYDEKEGTVLYTKHTIHGEETKYGSKSSHRPSFSTSGVGPGNAVNNAYKMAFQKSTFNRLLGSTRAAEKYINSKSYLARGHLSPDADFLFASSQFTSYYYINTCPQWQTINGGNWASLENTIRKAADRYQDTFTIITGTHDTLRLPDDDGNIVPIFLVSGQKLPVPKFIWKIMFDEDSRQGIAFISLNNPFVNRITRSDLLCKNICQQHGWATTNWDNITKGYIYCCDVREFARNVKIVPHLKVSGVLSVK